MFKVITEMCHATSERELINKSSDIFVFHRNLFTKENYIIFLNTPVLGYAGFRHPYCISHLHVQLTFRCNYLF